MITTSGLLLSRHQFGRAVLCAAVFVAVALGAGAAHAWTGWSFKVWNETSDKVWVGCGLVGSSNTLYELSPNGQKKLQCGVIAVTASPSGNHNDARNVAIDYRCGANENRTQRAAVVKSGAEIKLEGRRCFYD